MQDPDKVIKNCRAGVEEDGLGDLDALKKLYGYGGGGERARSAYGEVGGLIEGEEGKWYVDRKGEVQSAVAAAEAEEEQPEAVEDRKKGSWDEKVRRGDFEPMWTNCEFDAVIRVLTRALVFGCFSRAPVARRRRLLICLPLPLSAARAHSHATVAIDHRVRNMALRHGRFPLFTHADLCPLPATLFHLSPTATSSFFPHQPHLTPPLLPTVPLIPSPVSRASLPSSKLMRPRRSGWACHDWVWNRAIMLVLRPRWRFFRVVLSMSRRCLSCEEHERAPASQWELKATHAPLGRAKCTRGSERGRAMPVQEQRAGDAPHAALTWLGDGSMRQLVSAMTPLPLHRSQIEVY